MRYIVETRFTYGFENCWSDDDGQPLTFSTLEEAQEALTEHLAFTQEGYDLGHLDDEPQASDFQIAVIV